MDGGICFNHFNDNAIGRLNPKTGETKEWRWPYRAKEGTFAPTGARTMMGPDQKGRFYIGNQAQGGLVVFDPTTEKFTFVDPPGGGEMMDVSASHVDGHGWRTEGGAAYRINLETWEHTAFKGARPIVAYDIAADSKNNLFGAARNSRYVWRVDKATGQVSYYDIPAQPRSVGGIGARHAARQHGRTGSPLVGRLRRQLRRHARSAAARGQGDDAVSDAPLVLPLRRASRQPGLHLDRRHLRRPRRAAEREDGRVELLPAARSRPTSATSICSRPRQAGLSGLWLGHTHQALITLVEPLAP